MRITCQKCNFGFSLEPSASLTHVHCPQCGNKQPIGPDNNGAAGQHAEDTALAQEADSAWLVRGPSGKVRSCNELTQLQRWIVTGELKRNSKISKDGQTWKPLGEIKELAQFFSIAEENNDDERQGPSGGMVRGLPTTDAAFVTQPKGESLASLRRVAHTSAAPGNADSYEAGLYSGTRSNDVAKWVVISSILLIAASLTIIFVFILGGGTGSDGHATTTEAQDAGVLQDSGTAEVPSDFLSVLQQADGQGISDLLAANASTAAAPAWKVRLMAEELEHKHGYFDVTTEPSGDLKRKASALITQLEDLEKKQNGPLVDLARVQLMILANKRSSSIKRYIDRIPNGAVYTVDKSLLRARLLAQSKDYDRAITTLKSVVGMASDSGDMRVSLGLARLYLAKGLTEDARRHVMWVLGKDSQHKVAKNIESALATATGVDTTLPPPAELPDNASSSSAASNSSAPAQGYDSLIKQAKQAATSGNCSAAIGLYQKALDEDPAGLSALVGLGACYLDTGKTDDAIQSFRAALGTSSRNYAAMQGLATAYTKLGSPSKAADMYKQIIDTFPGSSKAAAAKRSLTDLGVGAPTPNSSSSSSSSVSSSSTVSSISAPTSSDSSSSSSAKGPIAVPIEDPRTDSE